jgi:hypothetical protein
MVQVIDTVGDACDAECIRFRVHRSRRDPNLILGSWQHAVDEHGMGSIGQSEPGVLGVSMQIEFQRAQLWAAQYGVPFLWVDDPAGLFPPAKRPHVAV